MVLEGYRARVAPYVARLARPYLGWRPDQVSWLAFACAALAGAVAAAVRWSTPLLFLAVAALIFLTGFYDVLDGEVARTTHRESARGDFLDHVLDRYADLVIVVGLAISGYANPVLALFALASLLLASYMGTQAQAVGQGRLYGGVLSRADRIIVLAVAALLEFLFSVPWPWASSAPWSVFHAGGIAFTVIDLALLYVVIGSQWTAIARALRVYRALPPA